MLEIQDLTKKYGSKTAVKQVNLQIGPGEIVGLFGENGAGYFRLTSFGDRENTIEAVERIKKLLSNL